MLRYINIYKHFYYFLNKKINNQNNQNNQNLTTIHNT